MLGSELQTSFKRVHVTHVQIQVHAFITSILEEVRWAASRPSRLTSRENPLSSRYKISIKLKLIFVCWDSDILYELLWTTQYIGEGGRGAARQPSGGVMYEVFCVLSFG